jgi:hypothetical protein
MVAISQLDTYALDCILFCAATRSMPNSILSAILTPLEQTLEHLRQLATLRLVSRSFLESTERIVSTDSIIQEHMQTAFKWFNLSRIYEMEQEMEQKKQQREGQLAGEHCKILQAPATHSFALMSQLKDKRCKSRYCGLPADYLITPEIAHYYAEIMPTHHGGPRLGGESTGRNRWGYPSCAHGTMPCRERALQLVLDDIAAMNNGGSHDDCVISLHGVYALADHMEIVQMVLYDYADAMLNSHKRERERFLLLDRDSTERFVPIHYT